MVDQKLKIEPRKMPFNLNKVDTKEFELPETLFVSDIDTRVFQGIVLQCLSEIEGITLVEGNFFDSFLGRTGPIVNGIHSEQDSHKQSVNIKIEVNIAYGMPIPAKAEEIQTKVAEEITKLTGLRVASIHVVFKNIIPPSQTAAALSRFEQIAKQTAVAEAQQEEEYSDHF